jgi:hypothetical protein
VKEYHFLLLGFEILLTFIPECQVHFTLGLVLDKGWQAAGLSVFSGESMALR